MEETWKGVIGYEDLYDISNYGNFYSNRKEYFLKPVIKNNGYAVVEFGSRHGQKTVHRLVAIHFIPNPLDLPQINHKDGDKSNNRVDNLEWCTASHNAIHAHRSGLHLGSKIVQQLLNGDVVDEFYSISEASRVTGEAHHHISALCNGRRRIKMSKYNYKFK